MKSYLSQLQVGQGLKDIFDGEVGLPTLSPKRVGCWAPSGRNRPPTPETNSKVLGTRAFGSIISLCELILTLPMW